jgi:hypothetical protein
MAADVEEIRPHQKEEEKVKNVIEAYLKTV